MYLSLAISPYQYSLRTYSQCVILFSFNHGSAEDGDTYYSCNSELVSRSKLTVGVFLQISQAYMMLVHNYIQAHCYL